LTVTSGLRSPFTVITAYLANDSVRVCVSALKNDKAFSLQSVLAVLSSMQSLQIKSHL